MAKKLSLLLDAFQNEEHKIINFVMNIRMLELIV
jgi:hypothetical protein